jgi:hypothetical protein
LVRAESNQWAPRAAADEKEDVVITTNEGGAGSRAPSSPADARAHSRSLAHRTERELAFGLASRADSTREPAAAVRVDASSRSRVLMIARNHWRFSGRLRGRALAAGEFALTARARLAGRASRPVSANFWILPPAT